MQPYMLGLLKPFKALDIIITLFSYVYTVVLMGMAIGRFIQSLAMDYVITVTSSHLLNINVTIDL